jgi:NDP-mannose synthase
MRAVVLAGGRGTRLRPFTTNFPKPLMPIGDVPILEILLRQLQRHGVTEVTIMSGHLAYLIEAYFGDGAALGLSLAYVREGEPLGTAGPLRQLRGRFTEDILVMNGDLLTDLDFAALMDRHRQSAGVATVSVYRHDERLELGVLQVDEAGNVVGYDEKPTLNLDISMGAYAMSPMALERIPAGRYDMPQLILDTLGAGQRVVAYRHDGLWFDIGRPTDFERANDLYASNPASFLPGGVSGAPRRGRPTRQAQP